MLNIHTRCAPVCCALGMAVQLGSAAAQTPAPTAAISDSGYSYFVGLARQEMRYRETVSFLPIESEATASNSMLVTGLLFPLMPDLLVSLDTATTFLPGRSSETWTAGADRVNGVQLTSRTLQTNRFSLSENNTQVLGHYRVRGPLFAMAGTALHNQSFKRFSFVSGPDKVAATPGAATVEESISEVMLNLGAALESETVRGRANHYSLRGMVGIPVWRRMTNTQNPEVDFNRASGVDFILEGRYSWAISPDIHLGGWGRFIQSNRGRQSQGNFEAPKSSFSAFGYGLEVLWKL
jgi:hypothetical protein